MGQPTLSKPHLVLMRVTGLSYDGTSDAITSHREAY